MLKYVTFDVELCEKEMRDREEREEEKEIKELEDIRERIGRILEEKLKHHWLIAI